MSDTLTTAEVAEKLGTDPKSLRKFFRSDKCDLEPVGQGKRYAITADDLDELQVAFDGYSKGSTKAKPAATEDEDEAEPTVDKAPAKAKKGRKSRKKVTAPEPEVIEDEDLDLDDDEPSTEALEAIAADDLDELDED